MPKTGQIRKALSGFYYVYSDNQLYQTRARGVFRNQDITPLVGDIVEFETENLKEGYILDIKERKNELKRPPIANIDVGICVFSAVEPEFSFQLLDRLLISLEYNKMAAMIVVTKMDLIDQKKEKELAEQLNYYQAIGYPYLFSALDEPWPKENLERFQKMVVDRTVVFMGQSGVGKSTLLNKLEPDLALETKEISTALGRGRHTTRHIELLPMYGGLIADTPGFSSLQFDHLEKEELPKMYPDFKQLASQCKFRGCMHHNEPQCAVKKEVEQGHLPQERYDHYLLFLNEIEDRKPKY